MNALGLPMNAVVLLFCVIPMLGFGAEDRTPGSPRHCLRVANAGAVLTTPTGQVPQQAPGWDLLPPSCQGEDSADGDGDFMDAERDLLIPSSANGLGFARTGSATTTGWISCHSLPLRC